jgi:copper chaperone CopZ
MFRILPRRLLIEPQAAVTRWDATAATLRIDGLVCTACATRVRQRLERIEGVRSARVDLDRGEAFVTHDHAAPEALVAAVEGAVLFPKARRLLAAITGHIVVGRGLQTPTKSARGSSDTRLRSGSARS